jgi:hypothetical protein
MSMFLGNDFKDLQAVASKYKEAYANAAPFPSICLDNVFDPKMLSEVLNEVPDLSKKDTINYSDDVQVKYGSKGERFFGEKTKAFMHYLNSEPFLNFLQELTGIEETLINDPYFHGAGQHEIKPGGFLKIHVDFNKHKTLGLDRRINVLVYLNKDWEESYGGHFELWKTDMSACSTKILPIFNRMAIFSTTDESYHGHPDPLNCPEGMSRKSLALYYYSNGRPSHEFEHSQENHRTLWAQRPDAENDNFTNKKSKVTKVLNRLKNLIK